MPKISVIMPAYNAQKFIGAALESILGQTFRDFELIVINDCSRDGTENIILSYDDERIVYVKNEENLGVARTLNKGLGMAKGEYVARMDADDISMPERFQKQAAFLEENPAVAVLGSNVETFDESGSLYTGWSATDPEQMHIDLLFSCGLAHPSVMMRTAVIRQLGGYDPEFEGLEDYELWCRVARQQQVTTLPDILFRYRVHGGQVTKNPSEKYLARLRRLKENQLSWLGLPTEGALADCYFDFCRGEKVDFWRLSEFFQCVLEAAHPYDPALLKQNFRSVLLSQGAKLPREQRRQVGKTGIITPMELAVYRLKRKLRQR